MRLMKCLSQIGARCTLQQSGQGMVGAFDTEGQITDEFTSLRDPRQPVSDDDCVLCLAQICGVGEQRPPWVEERPQHTIVELFDFGWSKVTDQFGEGALFAEFGLEGIIPQ
jgi:hypothetical protein